MREHIDYVLPINGEQERLDELNESLGTDLHTFEWHMNKLGELYYEALEKVFEAGGGYVGDGIRVKIEITYEPESK